MDLNNYGKEYCIRLSFKRERERNEKKNNLFLIFLKLTHFFIYISISI